MQVTNWSAIGNWSGTGVSRQCTKRSPWLPQRMASHSLAQNHHVPEPPLPPGTFPIECPWVLGTWSFTLTHNSLASKVTPIIRTPGMNHCHSSAYILPAGMFYISTRHGVLERMRRRKGRTIDRDSVASVLFIKLDSAIGFKVTTRVWVGSTPVRQCVRLCVCLCLAKLTMITVLVTIVMEWTVCANCTRINQVNPHPRDWAIGASRPSALTVC